MRVLISDEHALASIPAHSLVAYVQAEGWSATGLYGEFSTVFERGNSPEIIIPRSEEIGDYASVVSQIIDTLSREEGRDQLQVFSDLVSADKDLIRLSAKSGDEAGIIAIENGIQFIQHSFSLLSP